MTYQYTLADKMKNQFRGRGAALNGMRASSTSELMRRAEMGHDPRVNCAEQAFREQYNNRAAGGMNRVRREYSADKTMHTAVYSTVAHRSSSANRKQGNAPRTAVNNKKANVKNTNSRNNRRDRVDEKNRKVGMEPIVPSLEMPVKKKFLSPVFVAMLLVSTCMIMFLVMSISEIYETTNEIAGLENDIATLKSDAEELQLQLEEKNDIRLIEEIATKQLGMTKEDSLQRRYISLSDGEHIDILEVEEEKESGVLLSSIFAAIGDFLGND